MSLRMGSFLLCVFHHTIIEERKVLHMKEKHLSSIRRQMQHLIRGVFSADSMPKGPERGIRSSERIPSEDQSDLSFPES
jgi:hypothetical protein